MRRLRCIYWLLWLGLPIFTAYPIPSSIAGGSPHARVSWQWGEDYWIRYAIALSSVTATALTLAGCLCCQRHRRPKGFQDKAEKREQEFKDGSSIVQETMFDRSVVGLELNPSRTLATSERIQFEPLPVDSIVFATKTISKPKAMIPLSTPCKEIEDTDCSILQESYREWFNTKELYVPREKLKYLREIGHGWFGKVVEGRADLERSKAISKSGGVVVRILTEEATTKEKAWFLGEATPYLKLRHQNVLALLGFCLETDPYLLLFECCPAGDLKGFLLSNRDTKSKEILIKENISIRMAIEIATGLKHMHTHGFAHTDLSARNCLVASDLSAKLGDYGTSVEKYPEDYYIVGDRALPIRWSAPESLNCTDTIIETQEITLQANMWSYAILLWEIISWGERPYNDMNDEQVIQMILSLKNDLLLNGTRLLQNYRSNQYSPNIFHVARLCLNINAEDRPSLDDVRQILLNEHLTYLSDFEERWDNLQTNICKQAVVRSASLQNLRGSIDSDYWTHIVDDMSIDTLQSSFRFGPGDEQLGNTSKMRNTTIFQESGSETEEESWKGRIEQGIYTEKVKQKSKSVTDLMVLVHIEPDSDVEWSMTAQVPERNVKNKLPATCGSDSDLRHTIPGDEFDETLKKLRNSINNNTTDKIKSFENLEHPKLLTLTMDQSTDIPILRLSLNNNTEQIPMKNDNSDIAVSHMDIDNNISQPIGEKHVLRLLSKGDPDLPLLRYVPDQMSSTLERVDKEHDENSSNHSVVNNMECNEDNTVDVLLWNDALDSVLEQKIPGFSDETEFNDYIGNQSTNQMNMETPELNITIVTSTPNNLAHLAHTTYSICTTDNDFSTEEDAKIQQKSLSNEDDEEERKQSSTPDDEQSSDSGFRDKESCEEEEAVCPVSGNLLAFSESTIPEASYPKEETLQILFDTVLDAECYSTFADSKIITNNAIISPSNIVENVSLSKQSIFTNVDESGNNNANYASNSDFIEIICTELEHKNTIENIDRGKKDTIFEETQDFNAENDTHQSLDPEQYTQRDYENEDEDSSTVSLRSDNSYVSFGIEEEFVTAIRNELKEKLPHAQMQITESLEIHDEDDLPSISNDIYDKRWDDDENGEDLSNQISGGVDISIRYNVYGTPLSPILEERESIVTSDSLMSNSRETSVASKKSSVPSEDMLLVDAPTNEIILLDGLKETLQDDDRDTTNGDLSEEENLDYTCSLIHPLDVDFVNESHIVKTNGGAPLPSPEKEFKWHQLSTSFPLQDDLMSTSFVTEHGCYDQNTNKEKQEKGEQQEEEEEEKQEEKEEEEDEEEEEEEEEGQAEEEDEDDEDNSSSSGEFIWKRYNERHIEQIRIRSTASNDETNTADVELEEDLSIEEEEEEEEFIPSTWNAALAPHRSSLRSPDKTLRSGDQKKSVWFKKQRYHCVYEYPKETLSTDSQADTTTDSSEPTSYAEWEGMMDGPRLDLDFMDYNDIDHHGNEEFFVSSSNRPFQFETGESRYVSQFFPGANTVSSSEDRDEIDNCQQESFQNNVDFVNKYKQCCQQHQLGQLRHTRNRLTLNLASSNDTSSTSLVLAKQLYADNKQSDIKDIYESQAIENYKSDQCTASSPVNDNTLPKVPHEDASQSSAITFQCDNQELSELTKKCSVLIDD